MNAISEYILSICGAALICAIITPFLKQKSAASGIGKMATGIFLLLAVLRPLPGLEWSSLEEISAQVRTEAEFVAQTGEEKSRQALSEIIIDRAEAYILQKADALGIQITVEVNVSGDHIPVPETVYISGAAAPYAKRQLQEMIRQDLGIAKENLIWT